VSVRTTLALDDDLAAKLDEEARRRGLSLEQTLNEVLRLRLDRPPGTQPANIHAAADRSARLRSVLQAHPALHTEIASLDLLDDSALWNAARTRMPQSASEQMEELHRKQRLTGLSESEAEELTRLEEQYERVILVRSHSAWLLGQRGHDIRSLTTSSLPGE
jgi:hypothetical protein